MATDFKPLKVEDFELTSEEKKILVEGAQKFFPPEPDTEPAEKDDNGNQS